MENKDKEKSNIENENNTENKPSPDIDNEARKDEVPSPDADQEEAEKGLSLLDHQYRSQWQANGFPKTHKEMKELEEGENDDEVK